MTLDNREYEARQAAGERPCGAFDASSCAPGGSPAGSDNCLISREQLARLLQENRRLENELVRKQDELEAFLQRQQRDQRLIWQLMHHDPLTGLPNQLLMRTRISQAVAKAQQSGGSVGVLAVGIGHMKYINDSLGQGVGDFLLTTMAARFTETVGTDGTVARLAGDEFAIFLPDLRRGDEAETMARELLAAAEEPIVVDGHELVLTASIGIATFPADGVDPDSLLRHADAAMSLARREGSNNWQLYAADFSACALERLTIEEDLRRALERREFEIHYQPQIDAASGRIDGVEALVRWRRPGHGLVAPSRFIPLAEEVGLIVPIGHWVLENACAQLKAWHDGGAKDLRMAVNLSVCQVRQSDLVATVRDILRRTALHPRCLELEITESVLMQDIQQGCAVLWDLRREGVSLAIDDFGTGYSSLTYLKRFPIDTLKIDQSFVREIPRNAHDAAIAQALIALGHCLGLRVVAEGVETEEQLIFLQGLGCDLIQGYYFSPPLDALALEALLGRQEFGDS